MNVARTVVSTVSKSRSIQSQSEQTNNGPTETDERKKPSISVPASSMKAIFSLSEIGQENREGDQEFDMLMLDG